MASKKFPLSVVIQAVDQITAPMRKINRAITDTFKPVRMLGQSLNRLGQESGITRIVRGLGDARNHLSSANAHAAEFRNRMLMIGGAVGGVAYLFQSQFIRTADTFERLRLSLNAIEGSAEAGGKSMAFIMDKAMQTPYSTEEIAKTFRIMRGFGLDPTNGSLQSIVDQVAKLGGQGDDLTGIALQLGQAWSKARLQAQDANIMIERGVPVWGLLQRGAARLGKDIPIAKLREMSEKGQLGQKAIQILIDQMALESKGAADSMMKTWSGMISNIGDWWERFKLMVMASGPFEWLKGRIQALLDTVNRMAADGSLQKLAEDVGGRMVEAFKQLYAFGKDAVDVLRTMYAPVKALRDIFGSWKPLLYAIGIYLGAPLVMAIYGVAAAIGTLTIAMLSNPIGLFVVAVAGAIGVIYGLGAALAWVVQKVIDNWDSIVAKTKAFAKSMWDILKPVAQMLGAVLNPTATIGSALGRALGGAANATATANNAATGAPASKGGATGLIQNTQTNNAAVTVDFNNMPAGTRVTPNPGRVPLGLNLGFAMGG